MMTTCGVCGRTARADRHPCRFGHPSGLCQCHAYSAETRATFRRCEGRKRDRQCAAEHPNAAAIREHGDPGEPIRCNLAAGHRGAHETAAARPRLF
jgi:hypothetical protein